jgi:hypothetical protein
MDSYSYEDELREFNLQYPPINYKIQVKAKKSHTCEECGCEIHPNEYYWKYKPNPTYDKWSKKKTYHKWRKRCIDCEPVNHIELDNIKEV